MQHPPPTAIVKSKNEEGLARALAPTRASKMKSRRFKDSACCLTVKLRLQKRKNRGLFSPGSGGACTGAQVAQALETDFEIRLAVSWRIVLARVDAIHATDNVAVGTHSSKIGVVVGICVGATYGHAVEYVCELHTEFCRYALAKVEVFGQCKVFVAVKGIAQLLQIARLIALS